MTDALTSWNDTAVKSAIVNFVSRITTEGGANYVSAVDRIATFDNDGTLWCEQPLQVQFLFLADRVKHLAATDPLMKVRQPFKAVLERDHKRHKHTYPISHHCGAYWWYDKQRQDSSPKRDTSSKSGYPGSKHGKAATTER